MTTDKTDTIIRKKNKLKQMVLTDSMLNLHAEFLKTNPNVKLSYFSFFTLRPFYVTPPKASDRNTCMCHYHANANLMLQAFLSSGVSKTWRQFSFSLLLSSKWGLSSSHLMLQNQTHSCDSRTGWLWCSVGAVGESSGPDNNWEPFQHETSTTLRKSFRIASSVWKET